MTRVPFPLVEAPNEMTLLSSISLETSLLAALYSSLVEVGVTAVGVASGPLRQLAKLLLGTTFLLLPFTMAVLKSYCVLPLMTQ